MLKALVATMLCKKNGWNVKTGDTRFPHADVIAVRPCQETLLIAFATDVSDRRSAVCLALGRLLLMMDREVSSEAFGLPMADATLDPPLIEYAIAVPDDEAWIRQVREIPDRIRRLLYLQVLLVSDDQVALILPGVPI
jgi:hypothetical protein